MALTVKPVSVSQIGVEVLGCDLAADVTDSRLTEIQELVHAHSVLVFRNQRLSPEQQVAVTRGLGDIYCAPYARRFTVTDDAAVIRFSNTLENGQPMGIADAGQYWHSDRSFEALPSGYGVLHALEVPERQGVRSFGDTLFASASLAYESLGDELKSSLADLFCRHDFLNPYRGDGPATSVRSKSEEEVFHPVVRTHPATGTKCLFVNEQYSSLIRGRDETSSRRLLEDLFEYLRLAPRYRHQWLKGDVVIWDDCLVQHHAILDYALPQRRCMHKTSVMGSKPL
jgi:taurine dioxygenase